VTLVEKEAGVVIDYRASTFHPPTLDLLEQSGITAALVRMGLIAQTMQTRDRQTGKVAEFDLSALKNDTGHPYRLQCEQFKLVDHAYGELRKADNATLHFGTEIVDVGQDADGVHATIRRDGATDRIEGRYLIAADGGRSVVRKALGIGFEGRTYPEQFLVAGTPFDFKAHMPDICSVNYTADPVEWYLLLQIPDMWRVVTPVDPSMQPEDAISDRHLQKTLKNLLPRDEDYEIVVKAIYRVHQRVADRYRSGRILLAGDAAHLNNPLGGMGLNGGLHDAISLTRRLARVLKGEADESILDDYERERRPEAINAINAITDRNKRMLEERDPEIRRERLDRIRRTAADPKRAYEYMLEASMITSLRRSGLIGGARSAA
ncbi:MAG: FAD-dependent monooxygenase, partial [Azospirillaceae bacterium]